MAGYSAITSAVVCNRMSDEYYHKYLESVGVSELNNYYKTSQSLKSASLVSACLAVGVWITDIAWILLYNPGPKNLESSIIPHGLDLGSGFDPNLRAPMISLRYAF